MNQSAYFSARISRTWFSPSQNPPRNRKSGISRGVCATGYLPSLALTSLGRGLFMSLPREIQEVKRGRTRSNKDRTGRAQIPTRNNIFLWKRKYNAEEEINARSSHPWKTARLTRAIRKPLVRIIWGYCWMRWQNFVSRKISSAFAMLQFDTTIIRVN